jgi:multiple sugar transport system permease protein
MAVSGQMNMVNPREKKTPRSNTASFGRHSLSFYLRSAGTYLIMIALGLFFFVPILWMVSVSLKSMNETFAIPPTLLPQAWQWSNYLKAMTVVPFARYFMNSLLICTGTVVGTVLSCSLVAYALSRIRWWGRTIIFVLVLASMMLPGQVTMIPVFVFFRKLGWVGTFAPLIVPTFFGNAFYIFMMRQFFLTIPEELLDAARIDGASYFVIYWRIMLPLSVPVISTVALFSFLSSWNDFLGPLIYLTKDSMWTIAIGLRGFQSQHGWEWELLMAAAVIFTLPCILLYFFAQRSFMRGIVTTGFK